jgi:aminoglycoside phosphotransferase (APT) family kinase protein
VHDALRRRIEARLGVEGATVVEIEEGWDSLVLELDGEWIVRVPRRDEVRRSMRDEVRLLRALAPVLPVPVPRVEVVEDEAEVFFVAYRKLLGRPLEEAPASLAAELASFLAALHGFPRERAGVPPQQELTEAFAREVLPLLGAGERRRAEAMFEHRLSTTDIVLLHGDLGPSHILSDGVQVTGVIDWSDACLGDPALDFAWLLHGTNEEFATRLLDAYGEERGSDPDLRARALFYHRLGPWHEVLFGLKHGRTEFVESGLEGVRSRRP